jgi:hypothetical protein
MGWRHTSINQHTNAPLPNAKGWPSKLAGYASEQDNIHHVVFWATNGSLYDAWYRNTDGWHLNNLIKTTGGPKQLRFFAGEYSRATWDEAKKPILVTSSGLKRFTPQYREINVSQGKIESLRMRELRPLFGGKWDEKKGFFNNANGEIQRFLSIDQYKTVQRYENWRDTWSIIVPGNFGGSTGTDLLFYDSTTGEGVFYSINEQGDLKLLRVYQGWRKTWLHIVPGKFSGNSYTDLLFYDPDMGEAEFYAIEKPGNMRLIKRHSKWRKTWSQLVPADFLKSGCTDLLMYDSTSNTAELYAIDGQGNLRTIKSFAGWSKTWSHILPINPDYGYILLIDQARGEAELRSTNPAAADKGELYVLGKQSGLWRSWTHAVLGKFGGSTTMGDLLLYDAKSGEAEVFQILNTDCLLKSIKKYANWHRNWSLIVSIRSSKNRFTDLVLYDRVNR